MGIFSKLKNYVTGGGAELSVEIESPSLTEAFTVRVNAHIQSDDLAVESVYVKLRGLETVECRVNVSVSVEGKSVSSWENIHETKATHEQTLAALAVRARSKLYWPIDLRTSITLHCCWHLLCR